MPTPLQSPLSPVWAPCRQQNDVGKCGGDFLGGAVVASTAGGMSLIPGRGRSCVLSSVAKKKKKKKKKMFRASSGNKDRDLFFKCGWI